MSAEHSPIAWRARYFIAYAGTIGALVGPLALGMMTGDAYASACALTFAALVGGSAASRLAKRPRHGDGGGP